MNNFKIGDKVMICSGGSFIRPYYHGLIEEYNIGSNTIALKLIRLYCPRKRIHADVYIDVDTHSTPYTFIEHRIDAVNIYHPSDFIIEFKEEFEKSLFGLDLI